nr:chromo domain protein LHP1-like isoform X3 [Ipomoea trifida]
MNLLSPLRMVGKCMISLNVKFSKHVEDCGKIISLNAESSKRDEDGGIFARENLGAMDPLDSTANTQAPVEHLQLVMSHLGLTTIEEDVEDQ